MATDRTAPGAARIVKTERVTYVVTADDVTAAIVHLDVPWNTPFTDLNYTSTQNVEVTPPADPSTYVIGGFAKALDKVTVSVFVEGAPSPGDVIVVHAIAIHE